MSSPAGARQGGGEGDPASRWCCEAALYESPYGVAHATALLALDPLPLRPDGLQPGMTGGAFGAGMQGILYEEPSIWLFLLVTCLMGGWAAWMTGRAVALTWGPYWQCVLYLALLAWAVRFIHFACSRARCCPCITTSSTPS